MKKRLTILGLIALFLSLQIALAQIKTEDIEVAYGDRKLIDLNKKSPYTIKLHETSLLSFRYPGRTKNTMLVNNITRQGINVTMLGDAYKPGLDVFIKAEDYYRVFTNADKIPDIILEPKVYRISDDPKERTITFLVRRVEIIQGEAPFKNPVEVSTDKVTGSAVKKEEETNNSKDIILYSAIVIGAILLGSLYFYFDNKNKKKEVKNQESQ